MRKGALAFLFLFLLASLNISAQTSAAGNQQTPTIRTTTREVILDIVVRDKHHHAVDDIQPGEIQVFENGVRQKIDAFRNVAGAEQLRAEQASTKDRSLRSSPTSQESGTTLHELNFVSVVFAQIAPLNLAFAREAVLDLLKSDTLPNTYVTVYRLDRTLHLLQPYTTNKEALVTAVDAAAKGLNGNTRLGVAADTASGVVSSIQADTARIIASPLTSPATAARAEDQIINPIPGLATDPLWARSAASQDASVALGNALVTQSQLATGLRFAGSLSNGMDAMDALRQLIRVQAKLPGRKVVLYLADGLTLPFDRRGVVQSIISYANQMEVAFYTVDTQGLSVEDPMAVPLANQRRVESDSSVNNISPRMGHLEDDDVQLANSSNEQLALQELAESTGGFAVANTNQIELPMQHVMEDIRTHYEVAYTPSNSDYDGRFRSIQVHIDRPHVTVQTRSGYFALPEINGEPLQAFEMAALRAIDTHPAPEEFPYEVSLLRFRPKNMSVEYDTAFDIPIAGLHVLYDPKTGNGKIRLSVMALIHKSDGTVVGKVSRELARDIPKSEMGKLAGQDILYIEPVELAGGHYLVETAVTDELAKTTSVKRLSIFVDSGSEFGVSSLELVKNVRPLPQTRDHQDPFETDSGVVVPMLATSVPRGEPIRVFFIVYPIPNSDVKPAITLEMYRDGQEIGRQVLGPVHPEADGSIPILIQAKPDPGECDVVVTAQQGNLSSEARLSVKIGPGENVDSNQR